MTLVQTSTDPRPTAPEATRRERAAGPADSAQATRDDLMVWVTLLVAIAMSLGSNVFAVLQSGHAARSFGGIVYGAWPTSAFLAAAWLWHQEGRRGTKHRGFIRSALSWLLRLTVAVPAAYVSLLHVHATAEHFNITGMMAWASAVGMEAVTALALVALDDSHARRRAALDEGQADAELVDGELVDEGQAQTDALARPLLEQLSIPDIEDEDDDEDQDAADDEAADVDGTARRRVLWALQRDQAADVRHPNRVYAEKYGVSRQYVGLIRREFEGASA